MDESKDGRSTRPFRLSATALAVVYSLMLALPLALAWRTGIAPATSLWREAVSVTGLVGCMMLLLQFLTSGRYETLSGGVGIDVTMGFHKWAARLLLVIVILHPLLLQFPLTGDRLDNFWLRLGAALTAPRYLTGTVALVLVVLVVLLAILRDRLPAPYEIWRASHGLMVLAAAWLAVLHARGVGTYSRAGALAVLWPSLAVVATALLLGVHLVKSFRMRRQGWRIVANRKVADRMWELTIGPEEGQPGLDYRAGQFAWITFAPRRLLILDHPFSIASSPAAGSKLVFVIKEIGDFTRHVGELEPGRAVGIDAPHGSFTLADRDADAVVLIAGGVGIAPILGILRDLAVRGDRRPVRLIYAAGAPASMIDPKEIAAAGAGLDLKAQFVVEAAGEGWAYQVGRVGEAEFGVATEGLDPKRTAVMICGPAPMTVAVADLAARSGVPLHLVHYERFDYGGGRRSRKDRVITAWFWAMALAVLAAGTIFAIRG
jgi:predicted ferric reductase